MVAFEKRGELQARVYEDEYELVQRIIEGMNNTGKKNNYEVVLRQLCNEG